MPASTVELGYPDWQREANVDSPTSEAILEAGFEGTKTTSRFNVSRYQSLGGRLLCNEGNVRIRILWYLASAGGEPVGERLFYMTRLIGERCQLRTPNLGAWCEVLAETVKAGNKVSLFSNFFGSNRLYPLEFIPITPSFAAVGRAFKAGEEATVYPSGYASGPARLSTFTGEAVVQVEVQALTGIEEWSEFYVVNTGEGTSTNTDILLPSTAIRMTVKNLGAKEELMGSLIIPTVTGGG